VIKWKCVICARQMATEVKPNLIERLCPDCKVSHWQKVVEIYESGDKKRLAEAKKKLRAAVKALKKTQEVK
jgi:ribosomal protein L44E